MLEPARPFRRWEGSRAMLSANVDAGELHAVLGWI